VAPRIVPFIGYEDAAGAIDWLTHAFGFVENESQRYTEEDGRVTHAELSLQGATIYLANPTPEYVSPRRHRQECEAMRHALDNPYVVDGHFVEVDDVDAHFERASAAGATILRALEEPGHGYRIYTAEDPEGHRWMFGQRTE
jgi:uncharacterized glyoxalase superfamily protein PhnB